MPLEASGCKERRRCVIRRRRYRRLPAIAPLLPGGRGEEAVGILTDEMQRVVREQKLGYVATVCPDGTPQPLPKGTKRSWDENRLVFADIASPRTVADCAATRPSRSTSSTRSPAGVTASRAGGRSTTGRDSQRGRRLVPPQRHREPRFARSSWSKLRGRGRWFPRPTIWGRPRQRYGRDGRTLSREARLGPTGTT